MSGPPYSEPVEPLRLAFDVPCGVEHAFRTWTQRFGDWWPADHTATGEPELDVVLEPGVGGRILQRDRHGVEVDWGEVTLWDPPRRLGYRWHLRRDRADATDVLISFDPTPDGGTRLLIEHAGWERLGAAGSDWRDATAGGWRSLLPHYLAACAPGAGVAGS